MASIEVLLNLKNQLTAKLKDVSGDIDKLKAKMQGSADAISNIGLNQVRALKAAQNEIPGIGRGMDLITNKYTL
ncbi:MAG: hypothetical protein K2Q03_01225, partial [Sphingobacteriaceae bacterium]|nr:hypothetical protein [Sphingobacteriaceae bacterium]